MPTGFVADWHLVGSEEHDPSLSIKMVRYTALKMGVKAIRNFFLIAGNYSVKLNLSEAIPTMSRLPIMAPELIDGVMSRSLNIEIGVYLFRSDT